MCRILAALLLSMLMSEIEFTRIACLNYLATNEASTESASAWLLEDSTRGRRDIYHACCAGDVQAVAETEARERFYETAPSRGRDVMRPATAARATRDSS